MYNLAFISQVKTRYKNACLDIQRKEEEKLHRVRVKAFGKEPLPHDEYQEFEEEKAVYYATKDEEEEEEEGQEWTGLTHYMFSVPIGYCMQRFNRWRIGEDEYLKM